MNSLALARTKASDLDTHAIDRADLQPSTKLKYARALQQMADAGVSPMDHAALIAYADTLKASSRAFLKAALRLTTAGYEQDIKANVTPANVAQAQAAIMRLDAMRGAVKVKQHPGTKAHAWLTQKQVKEITRACADDLEGKRDWIILALLLGAGLRREELASLTFDALKQQPTKGGIRDVLEVKGKGAKSRVIPIKRLLADRMREWKQLTGGGRVARSLGMAGKLTKSMSGVAIFHLVRRYGALIDTPKLAPHDLRRTYAQLGYDAGVPITQISVLLGHADAKTTGKYLNTALDLETTVADFVPLSGD
jgi:integrase